jgi:hypothetical protein
LASSPQNERCAGYNQGGRRTAPLSRQTSTRSKWLSPKLKALLRRAAARTISGLWHALKNALKAFTPNKCRNHFAAARYDALIGNCSSLPRPARIFRPITGRSRLNRDPGSLQLALGNGGGSQSVRTEYWCRPVWSCPRPCPAPFQIAPQCELAFRVEIPSCGQIRRRRKIPADK